MRFSRLFACLICLGLGSGSAHVWAAEDAAERALREQQLQRRQQQEALQLRMQQQQQQRTPPVSPRRGQSLEQSHGEQRQRQQALHYRQSIERGAMQPSDDRGTRQAKEAIQRMIAERETQQEIRQPRPEP